MIKMKNTIDKATYGLDKDAYAVLDGELQPINEYGQIRTFETDKAQMASPQAVFDLINAIVTAVEDEANARGRYDVETYGELSYAEKRTLELVNDYDDFINAPDFELDVFTVGILDMENFWRVMARKNNYNIRNKAVTYGKSTIYSVGYRKGVIGFLANNMTYDGQNSFCLTSVKARNTAYVPFRQTGKYPKELRKTDGTRNRWARVLDELAANDGDISNAWCILEEADSQYFYAELKKHNGVGKENRQQLQAIRNAAGGETFINHVEAIEISISKLETARDELEHKLDNMAANSSETKREAVKNGIKRLDNRLYDLNIELWDLTEEHNSETAETTMEDY